MSFLVLVVYSKHLHIFMAPLNVAFTRQPSRLGALDKTPEIDIETMDEDTIFGAGRIEHFTWKQLLDLVTCTECGRCQSQCPAWNTGKALSPKLVMMDLREELFRDSKQALVPNVITEDVLWACTTCGACVEQCPVDIEHIDAIIDMRRYEVLIESRFPSEAALDAAQRREPGRPLGPRGRQAARVDREPRLRGPRRRRHDPRRRRVPLLGRAAPEPWTSGPARPPSRSPACCTAPG